MTVGSTTTGSLADSLDSVRSSARTVRAYEGVIPGLCDRQTLGKGIGLSWLELSYAALTATAITEQTELDNPQQLSDTLLTITPTQTAIHTFITDRVRLRINPKGLAQLGGLAQKAIQRLKDEDGLVAVDGATTSLCGTATTLNSGYISTAVRRISSNATEPGNPPYRCVLHGYQIKDIEDELKAGIGTYVVTEGETSRVFKEGFRGQIGGAQVFEDGLIPIDSTPDAKGGVFAKEALILVQGRSPRAVNIRNEKRGGGGDELILYDEYAYGERSAGNWLYEIQSDATTPTS